MAVKKKSPQSSTAAEKRASNKKKSQGTTVTYKGKQVTFPKTSTAKPTTAITAKGQKATGLAKSAPGTRYALPRHSQKAYNAVDFIAKNSVQLAAGVASGGVAGKIVTTAGRALAARAGGKAAGIAGEAAFNAATRGLAGATGRGGRVSRTMTPFGPTLRSTAIGTPAQQSARIENLVTGATKAAKAEANRAKIQAMIPVLKKTKPLARASRGLAGLGGTAATGKVGSPKKTRKK
jgi:hypothetical protein